MITIVTGTVGLDKGPYLDKVAQIARGQGQEVTVCHVGERMYREAPDVMKGRILDLSMARLKQLRRSVFKDILALGVDPGCRHLIVNTHATFRWRHGLFPAFDFDLISQLDPDMYVCLIDNVDAVHARLVRDHQIDHSLKDLMVWREEEILATEMMMLGCGGNRKVAAKFYVQATGGDESRGHIDTSEMLYRLMFEPKMPKAYLSFPMTHVADMPTVLDKINRFRQKLAEHFIIFDPGDLEEYQLYQKALTASHKAQKFMEIEVLGQKVTFDVPEVIQVAGDIFSQIYARDFMLIDQSDMIISYIPQMPDGRPVLSSGVERELQHAHEATREVFIIWRPSSAPSPFITETATKVFGDTEEALEYFRKKGYIN